MKVSLNQGMEESQVSKLHRGRWKVMSEFYTSHCLQMTIPMSFLHDNLLETQSEIWNNQLLRQHGHPKSFLLSLAYSKIQEK